MNLSDKITQARSDLSDILAGGFIENDLYCAFCFNQDEPIVHEKDCSGIFLYNLLEKINNKKIVTMEVGGKLPINYSFEETK